MTKVFGPFFLVLPSVTNLKDNFIRVHKLFWQSLKIFIKAFLQDLRDCWKHKNLEKRQPFQWWNDFGPFFRFIQHDKCQRKFCWGPRGFLTYIVQMTRSFLRDLRGRQKQTFQKKAVFTMTNFLAHFSSYHRVSQTSGSNIEASTSYSISYCGTYRSIFLGPKRLLKTEIFQKRQTFHWKKNVLPIFSRFIEHEKCQRTIYKGPQCIFTIFVQLIKTFLWDLRDR